MSALDPSRATWRKSSRSNGNGSNCVEVGETAEIIGVRDSKDRSGPVLAFGPEVWVSFIEAVKAGEFDNG
jgi:hypothetical protein